MKLSTLPRIFTICWLLLSLLLARPCLASGPAPLIIVPPLGLTVSVLGIATFTVVASSGTTMSYQWMVNGTNVPGATSSIFTILNAGLADQGNYSVKIVNGGGSVTSQAVSLVVLAPPIILTQPVSQIAVQNQDTSFSVVANGTAPVSYRWSFNGVAIPGGAGGSATLSLENVTTNYSGNYTVVVTDSLGSITSTTATLTVLVPPAIAPPQQPQNLTAPQGQSASFSVAPTGSAPLSYQWNFKGSPLSGATSSILTVTNVQPANAGGYTVLVTNLVGTVTSSSANLTVTMPPAITTQPVSQVAMQGHNTSFAVVASGTGPLTYRWYFNGVAVTGPAGGAATLTLNGLTANSAGAYAVVVTNSLGSVTSAVATLTVTVAAGITTQPQSQSVLPGQNASFSVVASGTAPFSYQWNLNGLPLSGATGSTLALASIQITQAGSYTVTVTNVAGSVTSAAAVLSINGPPLITAQPQSLAVSHNDSASFSVSSVGTAPLNYRWYINGVAVGGPAGAGATFTLGKVKSTDAANYSVVVTNSLGSVTSAVATLTVDAPPFITIQPQPQSVAPGQNVSFSIAAIGLGTLSYQWYFNGASLAGATTSSLTCTNVQTTNAGNYAVLVANSIGSVTSVVATLTVTVAPAITIQPQSQSVLAGHSATFNALAIGTGPLSYYWNFNNVPIAGATNSVLTVTNALTSATGSYSLTVTNSVGATTSAVASLAVTLPAVTLSATGGAAIGMTPNGFAFQFSAPVGATSIILASSDMINWTPIATNTVNSTNVVFTDPASINQPSRFYRVLLQ